MTQYISLMRPGRKELENDFFNHLSEDEAKAFQNHVGYLKDLFNKGKIIFAGPSVEEGEDHFAIVVLNAPDKTEAEKIMNEDPAVSAKILTSKVSEFQVFLSSKFEEN